MCYYISLRLLFNQYLRQIYILNADNINKLNDKNLQNKIKISFIKIKIL